MKLISLNRAFSVKPALARYNRKYRVRILERDLHILYTLKKIDFPTNRLKIQKTLAKTNLAINYNQLNQSLEFLIDQRFVERNENNCKKLLVTPSGIEFLYTIETWSRRIRLDKVI